MLSKHNSSPASASDWRHVISRSLLQAFTPLRMQTWPCVALALLRLHDGNALIPFMIRLWLILQECVVLRIHDNWAHRAMPTEIVVLDLKPTAQPVTFLSTL